MDVTVLYGTAMLLYPYTLSSECISPPRLSEYGRGQPWISESEPIRRPSPGPHKHENPSLKEIYRSMEIKGDTQSPEHAL